ncbi:CB1 cannabinoid receptor-interacting protein 1 [Paroedura picta]|uniref:CB1 cannabinoid receptor-interacting protein 1 n=1 Tax=Paroedura picta TaxID=143630 RepID=UPI00101531AC
MARARRRRRRRRLLRSPSGGAGGRMSGAGSAMPALVRLSVALKVQPSDGPVFFKVDGQRFGQNRTIKLLTGAKYRLEVVAKPGALRATTMSIGTVTVPLEEKSRDAQMVVYNGIYDTEGVPHTKSGERQPIQVTMQLTDIGTFETVWQVKFYNYHKRDHCQWGNSFASIEYECKPNETRTLLWINKESFQ